MPSRSRRSSLAYTLLLLLILSPTDTRLSLIKGGQASDAHYVDREHQLPAAGPEPALAYRLLAPDRPPASGRFSLLIYLHGAGGSLREVNVMRQPYDQLRNFLAAHGYYLLLPELGPTHWMNDRARRSLDRIVKAVLDNNPIDRRHVHVMGTSMGGGSALAYAIHRPDLIRSVCSHLGMTDFRQWYEEVPRYRPQFVKAYGGDPQTQPEAYRRVSAMANLDVFANTPVFLAYAAADRLVPPQHGKQLAAALQTRGYSVVYREHPTAGHADQSIEGFGRQIIEFFNKAGETDDVIGAPQTLNADETGVVTAKPDQGTVRIRQTPDGIRFGLLGGRPAGPSPTIFIFASNIERTLGDPYYRQSGNDLMNNGWLCVSLDLPAHGLDKKGNEPGGLRGWRHRLDNGEPLVEPWQKRVSAVIDFLIEQGYTQPDQIAACGTSRGGYAAMQAAAHDARIKAVAAFAPVTDLGALREFREVSETPRVRAHALTNHVESLAARAVWLVIGDQDERVGTDHTITLARQLTRTAQQLGLPSQAALHVIPAKGHTTPPGAPEQASAWFQSVLPATVGTRPDPPR